MYYEEITIKAPEIHQKKDEHTHPHIVYEMPYETNVTINPLPDTVSNQVKTDRGWRPYTLRDYKAQMQQLRHSRVGGLGPNVGGEEHQKQVC